jgi:DNA-binding transcriptional LysR family regulator
VELRHLRYFVAVAEELHFRRASERLHIAQPAVSQQIRKLESELGVALFARSQRSVALTAAGSAMLEEARGVLRQADVAQRAAREADGRAVGRLRIGYLRDALPTVVPRLLCRFAAAAPGIRMTLVTGAARSLLDDVRENRLDVAVTCLPGPVAGMRVIPIGHEGTVAAVPERHPCARETTLALSGLEHTALVTLPRTVDPAFYDGVLGACSAAGIAPALLESPEPDVEQVLLAVASGVGIALLPASTEGRFSTPGVRFVTLAPPVPSCEVALVAQMRPSMTTAAFVRLAAESTAPRRALHAVA